LYIFGVGPILTQLYLRFCEFSMEKNLHWIIQCIFLSSFVQRGLKCEKFTYDDDDDERKVMTIAHMPPCN
jgi:hypothetical protein